MRSEIFPEIPVKSRHCAIVEIVDNVDKMIRMQGIEGKNPGDIGKIMIGGKCCKISYVNIKIHIPKKQVCQLECG